MSTDTGAVSVRVQPGRKNHVGKGILIETIYRGEQMFPVNNNNNNNNNKKQIVNFFGFVGQKFSVINYSTLLYSTKQL